MGGNSAAKGDGTTASRRSSGWCVVVRWCRTEERESGREGRFEGDEIGASGEGNGWRLVGRMVVFFFRGG